MKLYKPCQKLSLHDIVAFRTGNSRAGFKHSVFPQLEWCSDDHELRTIHIRHNFSIRTSHQVPTLALTCRRFIPGPNDVLDEPYEASDGEVTIMRLPPFACVLLFPRPSCLLLLTLISSRLILTLEECEKRLRFMQRSVNHSSLKTYWPQPATTSINLDFAKQIDSWAHERWVSGVLLLVFFTEEFTAVCSISYLGHFNMCPHEFQAAHHGGPGYVGRQPS